ncbi:MAG: hypothetical protein IPP14_11085 [Planctomycetes bacterium]|nr:hypothetical protein [Planctomycetota bacterium]
MTELVYQQWHEGLNPDECVSVDGNAPGRLNLSHWPGNRTPESLRHDLSTGSCLLLAKAADRVELLRGITTVTNNHWDTDGLCSAFALLQPALAQVHGQTLVAAALAGDFEMFTTPEGVKIDLTVTALTRHSASPVRSDLFTQDLPRRQAQYLYGLELLPKLLANPDLHADWFAQEFWTIQKDMREIREENAVVENFAALDFATVRAERLLHNAAVNTILDCDRILGCFRLAGQWHYQLRLTTRSWFHMKSRALLPRPDWQQLVDTLNAQAPGQGGQWHADDLADPAPSLRFAKADGTLAPNGASPAQVSALVTAFFSRYPRLDAGI